MVWSRGAGAAELGGCFIVRAVEPRAVFGIVSTAGLAFASPMLQLRPACENCNKPLPPDSTEARICSYECTFCAPCVGLLGNVCPNCGGGFVPRPIRPSRNWKDDNYLGKDPASTTVRYQPVDAEAHAKFSAVIRAIPPETR